MNTAETMRMLTDKDPATGEYRIPRIIYSDAYYSETVAYADLCCPTRPISNAGTASRCSIGRSAGSEGPADAIRHPIVTPDRDVRPFQDVLIEIGCSPRAARLCDTGGRAALSRRLPRLHRQSRAPAWGRAARRLARHRGRAGRPWRAEPASARALYREWLLLEIRAAGGPALFQARQQGLSRNRGRRWDRSICRAADRVAALCRAAAAVSPRGPRAWSGGAASRPSRADRDLFRSAAVLVHAVRGSADRSRQPSRSMRVTQRPMQMYHSWHSQNAWLRQILGRNRLFVNRTTGRALGLDEEDWVWVVEPSRPNPGPYAADGRGQP